MNADMVIELLTSDKSFDCPHCGHSFDLSDSDVYTYVISYHGEEHHDFNCTECGEDFVVIEFITRRFDVAKTITDYLESEDDDA